MSRATIRRLKLHVEVAERFPFMQPWSRSRVLRAWALLRRLPEGDQAKAIGMLEVYEDLPRTAFRILRNMVFAVGGDPR